MGEIEKEYYAAIGRGDSAMAESMSASLMAVQVQQAAALQAVQNASVRMDEIANEVAEKQSEISKTRAVQYEAEITALGELSEAQQLIADQEYSAAMDAKLSVEQFAENVNAAIEDTGRLAAAEAELAASSEEVAAAVEKYGTAEKARKSIQNVTEQRQQAAELRKYVEVLKTARKGSDEYNTALEKVSELMGGYGTEAVKASEDAWDSWVVAAEQAAETARTDAVQGIQLLIDNLDSLELEAAEAAEMLQWLNLAKAALLNGLSDTSKSSGGGGSARKKAWEEELDMINRVMDAEGEYAQAYLDHINSLLASDRLSKSERKRLEQERAYAQRQVDGELEQAHIDYLERVLARERLSAEQRLDVEQQLFEAKRALMDNYSDFADAITSAITARAEAQRDAELSAIQAQIDAVSDWENAQSDAIRAVMDERIDAINAQIRALDDLSKAQDRADKDEEDADKLRRLQAQLAFEKDERNRQKLTEQIAALETATKKRHAQEQLEDQKQALKDQQDAIRDEADKQLESIKNQADAERDMLNQRLASAQAYWEQRLSVETIMQEAILFLQQSSQEEILALLDKYAPEYLNKGKLLGSQLLGGLKPKIDACIDEIKRLRAEAAIPIVVDVVYNPVIKPTTGGTTGNSVGGLLNSITTFAADPQTAVMGLMANVQSAMDSFAARSLQPAASATGAARSALSAGGQSTRNVKVEQTVVLQQPVPTPYQTAKALRRESEQLAKLL
jgi:hypothetical protein